MDKSSYIGVIDIYYINNEDISKQNKVLVKDGIIYTNNYDDIFNTQLLNKHFFIHNCNLNMANPTIHENGFCKLLKHYVMHLLIITNILAVAAFLVYNCIFNTCLGISPPKYPLLNPDLCDPVHHYHDKDWFLPIPTTNSNCDRPIQVREVYFEGVMFYKHKSSEKCKNKLNCMANIGLYLAISSAQCKYNVYAARGWLCPYVSGQLWVAVIVSSYNTNDNLEIIQLLLEHFNKGILSYASNCSYFVSSGLNIIYLNNTLILI